MELNALEHATMPEEYKNDMPVARLGGLPAIDLECATCGLCFGATMFSRAFTDDIEFICASCGLQTWISSYLRAARYTQNRGGANGVDAYLKPCDCGGRFVLVGRRYDLYRCPDCKALLGESYVLDRLGIDRPTVESHAPFCGHVVIDGESIEYTHPGLETIGHFVEIPWNHDISDALFHEALAVDVQIAKDNAKTKAEIHGIREKIRKGVFPPELCLQAGLDDFLCFNCGGITCAIRPADLPVNPDLIEECRAWARLGSYIEDGAWGEGDFPPESFVKTSWTEYYQAGLNIQKKLQAALGAKTVVRISVEPTGSPFFGRKT